MSIDDMTTCIFAKGIQHHEELKQQRELNRAKRVTVFRDPREDRGNNLSSLEKKGPSSPPSRELSTRRNDKGKFNKIIPRGKRRKAS